MKTKLNTLAVFTALIALASCAAQPNKKPTAACVPPKAKLACSKPTPICKPVCNKPVVAAAKATVAKPTVATKPVVAVKSTCAPNCGNACKPGSCDCCKGGPCQMKKAVATKPAPLPVTPPPAVAPAPLPPPVVKSVRTDYVIEEVFNVAEKDKVFRDKDNLAKPEAPTGPSPKAGQRGVRTTTTTEVR